MQIGQTSALYRICKRAGVGVQFTSRLKRVLLHVYDR